jgi:hypothetical protein
MSPLHGIETSKLTSRTYESKNKKTGEKEKKIAALEQRAMELQKELDDELPVKKRAARKTVKKTAAK